jgi:hypothetical protein
MQTRLSLKRTNPPHQTNASSESAWNTQKNLLRKFNGGYLDA